MKRFTLGAATVGILAGSALGLAGTAAAAPLGGSSAGDAVSQLQAQGYNVHLNYSSGLRDVPLSQCTVNGVHGLNALDSADNPLPPSNTTVYVDVNCADDGAY
jgi:hypothetical protein